MNVVILVVCSIKDKIILSVSTVIQDKSMLKLIAFYSRNSDGSSFLLIYKSNSNGTTYTLKQNTSATDYIYGIRFSHYKG